MGTQALTGLGHCTYIQSDLNIINYQKLSVDEKDDDVKEEFPQDKKKLNQFQDIFLYKNIH